MKEEQELEEDVAALETSKCFEIVKISYCSNCKISLVYRFWVKCFMRMGVLFVPFSLFVNVGKSLNHINLLCLLLFDWLIT